MKSAEKNPGAGKSIRGRVAVLPKLSSLQRFFIEISLSQLGLGSVGVVLHTFYKVWTVVFDVRIECHALEWAIKGNMTYKKLGRNTPIPPNSQNQLCESN